MTLISVTYPDGTVGEIESNDDVVVHGVDADGVYMGLVDPALATHVARGAPQVEGSRWIGGRWLYSPTLEDLIFRALETIDAEAGKKRLAYITDVPGQQGTYIVKAEQAAAFIADPDGPVPPYIQAEVDAMGEGATALQAAQVIAGTAALWSDVVGPAIERERLKGKRLAEAATTPEELLAAVDAALASLRAI